MRNKEYVSQFANKKFQQVTLPQDLIGNPDKILGTIAKSAYPILGQFLDKQTFSDDDILHTLNHEHGQFPIDSYKLMLDRITSLKEMSAIQKLLIEAVENESVEKFSLLLKKSSEINLQPNIQALTINSDPVKWIKLLIKVTNHNNLELVTFLIQNGIDPRVSTEPDAPNALYTALSMNDDKLLREIVKSEKIQDVDILHYLMTTSYLNEKTFKVLLDRLEKPTQGQMLKVLLFFHSIHSQWTPMILEKCKRCFPENLNQFMADSAQKLYEKIGGKDGWFTNYLLKSDYFIFLIYSLPYKWDIEIFDSILKNAIDMQSFRLFSLLFEVNRNQLNPKQLLTIKTSIDQSLDRPQFASVDNFKANAKNYLAQLS